MPIEIALTQPANVIVEPPATSRMPTSESEAAVYPIPETPGRPHPIADIVIATKIA